MSLKDELISGDDLLKNKRERKQEYSYISILPNLVDDYIKKGWEIDREYKTTTRMKKNKTLDEIFENQIWVLFSDLGFKYMNKDRHFAIPYSKDNNKLTQQIDVFAVDEETVIIIECKASQTKNKKQDFKTELEAINGKNERLIQTIKKDFPNHKIKTIFATKNYNVGAQDRGRMEEFGIMYFDEENISYYSALANHLGEASRYQLLGNLFAKQKIQELKNVVPAIFGKMGGHNYYSFSIEPETLLKLGYVLHRNNSNKDSMPTYQRIIKKSRLKKIQEFVENGGYFPNSIIVSIEPGKKGIRFDQISQGSSNSSSKIGFLHLPQVYRSIYIIDGQHRLYGYSNSKYRDTNTIPVVAFENLDQDEQVKIFMDINENQKAVPKNLRNTLNEDLKYESKDPSEQRDGLALKISRELGEDRDSPLFDRVVIGENVSTPERCITLETLSKAIKESNFFSKFKKTGTISHGTFDFYDNDKTFCQLYPVLSEILNYLKTGIGDNEWQKVNTDKTAFVKNNVISGIIRLINSLVIYLSSSNVNKIQPLANSPKSIFNELKPYLDVIITFWKNASEDDKMELSTFYGAGGPIKACRIFEREINLQFLSFQPDGLIKYWGDRNKENTYKAAELIESILTEVKEKIKMRLDNSFGEDRTDLWFPKSFATDIAKKTSDYNYGKSRNQYKDPWDFVDFLEIKEILVFSSNWTDIFERKFSFPTDSKGDKKEKTSWLKDLYDIRKRINTTSAITLDDLDYIKNIDEWLKTIF